MGPGESTFGEKHTRARKMMLWFGIVSLIMGFAGWTSAFIVSSTRDDWMRDLQLPSAFFWSTLLLLFSSLTFHIARTALKAGRSKKCTAFLLYTLLLGLLFVGLQFYGFSQMIGQGYYFTGPTSNITMSYIFLIAAVHLLHLGAGLISLMVVLLKQLGGKYSPESMLGMDLGATFWHFLDFLWVYLILFMYFFR